MTTLVYRDGVLAADTGASHGAWRMMRGLKKVVRVDYGSKIVLAAAAGDCELMAAFLDWQASGQVDARPVPGNDASLEAIEVTLVRGEAKPTIRLYQYAGSFEIEDEFVAFGSGSPAALGALHVGASAVEAVEAAMKVSSNTFGKVASVSFKE